MAITTAFPNARKLEALQAIAASTDVFKAVLLQPTANFDKAATVYDGTGEIASGNGYTTGGQTLTGYSAALDGDTAVLDFADPSWSSATISAGGLLIVNQTKGNKIIGVYSFGATVTSTNDTFKVTLPAPTAAAGLIRI